MKIGIIKKDIAFPVPETFWEKHEWYKIAKQILKTDKKYEVLWEDTDIKCLEDFREAVTRAYLVDCILEQHPDLKLEYEKIKEIEKESIFSLNDKKEHVDTINFRFLGWYSDYLRDLADPGVVEREREAHRQEMARLHAQHEAEERQAAFQLQQDLAAGKRVVCPYCKSTNTEKISGVARGVSIYVMGIASPKIGKQWHCNNCKSDF